MSDEDDDRPVPAPSSRTTERLDTAAVVASFVPVLGGPVAGLLSGFSTDRKLLRVHEVLVGFAEDLRDLRSEAAEQYVRTEDFAELMEKTVRAAADGRREEKRRLYRAFLVGVATEPAPYDEQVRVLRILEELQVQHVRVLRAMIQEPAAVDEARISGSFIGTLERRVPDLPRETIAELVAQLNRWDLTSLRRDSLGSMMTPRGAEDLRSRVTPLGQRLVGFLLTAPAQ